MNVVKSQSPNEDSVSKPEISSAKRVNVSSQISKKPEKRATIRGSAIKREQPDIFKAFSKPMPKLNHENTDSSATGIAPTATGLSVRYAFIWLNFIPTYDPGSWFPGR